MTDSLIDLTTGRFSPKQVAGQVYAGATGFGAMRVATVDSLFTAPAQTGLATGITVASRSGSLRTSAAAIKSGVTVTTPAAPQWLVVGKSDSANTGVASVACLNVDLKGGIMIPPLTGLAFGTLSGAGTTPLFAPVATWTEAAQDLE